MTVAIALQEHTTFQPQAAAPSRGDIFARYLQLRAVSKQHANNAVKFLSGAAILQQARRLGLAVGNTLLLDDPDEMVYVYDLVTHTAPAGRTRTIDRYARSTSFAPQSDEGLVLAAMRKARFSIMRIERRHEVAGLIVTDLMRDEELWLVDQGMEATILPGRIIATRLYAPESFWMMAGVQMPIDLMLLDDALWSVPQLDRRTPREVADDRRLAEAIYRSGLASGAARQVAYKDPVVEAG